MALKELPIPETTLKTPFSKELTTENPICLKFNTNPPELKASITPEKNTKRIKRTSDNFKEYLPLFPAILISRSSCHK